MADRYKLYYWPIPFRRHFIRYILAHVGAEWGETGFEEIAAFKDRGPDDKPYPFLAPPVLHDLQCDTWLSQLPAIAMYLGRKYDLITDEDQTLRLICDASDILFEITRYHGALLWDRDSWAAFTGDRLPVWMRLHERLAVECGARVASGHMFGAKAPGLADLIVAALWHTMIDRLPALRPVLHENAPVIEGLADRIATRAEIVSMLADWEDSDQRYCAGQIEESILEMLN